MSNFTYTQYNRGWKVSGTLPDGQRLRKSLKGFTKREAQEYVAHRVVEAKAGLISGQAARQMNFAEAAKLYRASGRCLNGLDKAVACFGQSPVNQITPAMVIQFAQEHYRTPSTRNNQGIKPVRAVLNYAHKWLKTRDNAMTVPAFQHRAAVKKQPPADWLERFCFAASQMGWKYLGLPELAVILMITGRRTDEWLKVTWDDIEWDAGRVLLRDTKNGDDQYCRVPSAIHPPLRMLRADQLRQAHAPAGEFEGMTQADRRRLTSGKVFPFAYKSKVWQRWKEVCDHAGIEYITPHASGRHSFATRLNKAGWQANDIAVAGGWKSVSLVQKTYIHAEDRQAEASEIMLQGIAAKRPAFRVIPGGKDRGPD